MTDDIIPEDFEIEQPTASNDSDQIFPFGKYAGERVDDCDDVDYMQWVLEQDWVETKYPLLWQTVQDRLETLGY